MGFSDQEIRMLLGFAHEQEGWLTPENILAKMDLGLKPRQLEGYLLSLCDEELLEEKPKRTPVEVFDTDRQTSEMRTFPEYEFRITSKGEHLINATRKAGD